MHAAVHRDEPSAVLVVGSIAADVTAYARRAPQRGETFAGEAFSLVLGGKGANQAIAAARAGATAHLVGCVGDDALGALVSDALRDAGIGLDHVRVVPGPTGVAHIRVYGDGENDIVIVAGANAALDHGQVDRAFASLGSRAGVMLAQLETPLDVTERAIRRAHAAGIRVVLDPAPARALEDDLWRFVDVVTPNETEARLLTGIAVDSRESAEAAGRWFVERGAGAAVVTLAAAGSLVVTAEGAVHHPPVSVEVVDTTAAGDAFAGYLAAALAHGSALESAVRRATAAGALAVTREGASPSVPTAAAVDALLRSRPPC